MNDLRSFIEAKPELFKEAIKNPDITKKTLAFVSGIIHHAKRSKIPLKNVRITGPMAGSEGYDAFFTITRKP